MRFDAIVDGNYADTEGAFVYGIQMFRRLTNALDQARAPYNIFIKNGLPPRDHPNLTEWFYYV